MVYNNVILNLKNINDAKKVGSMLATLAELSREEPGCDRFEVYHSQSDAQIFMLVERWITQEHLDEHKKADSFAVFYMNNVIPLVNRVPHPCTLIA